MPARHGVLGSCAACQQPIPSHFDATWQWIGCTALVPRSVVFMLVPVPLPERNNGHDPVASDRPVTRTKPKKGAPIVKRQFMRAAYRATLPEGVTLDSLVTLSPNRRRVLAAVLRLNEESQVQPVTKDVIHETKLGRGIVSEALVWLRSHALVEAVSMDSARFSTPSE